MASYTKFDISPEMAAAWAEKLAKIAQNLNNKEKEEEAKMMYLCSLLMVDLVTNLECQRLVNPFPIVPGVA